MTPAPVDVAVVIPLYNGRDFVADCLRSIPPGIETIVVDDGSTDGAPELVEATFPEVVVVRNEQNRGFGSTCNRGLRMTSARTRIVLNSDATLDPGAIEALEAALALPGVGIAGARRRFPDGSHQTSAAAFPTVGSIIAGSFLLNEIYRTVTRGRRFPWELGLSRSEHDADRDVDWVSGTCLAISAECFETTGGFDEAYHLYVEETDLCWRARRAGWRVRYVADAGVVHVGGGSTGDPELHATRFLRSEARFMARANGRSALRGWRAARLVGSLLKLPAFGFVSAFDHRARERFRWHRSAIRCLVDGSWREGLDGVG